MVKVHALALPEVQLLEPPVWGDARGFFLESFNQREVQQALGLPVQFVQDNHSRSTQGVLRGLHYQLPPHAQGKLVRVLRGHVWDVVVDVRATSPRMGQWVGCHLTEDRPQLLWVPPGFAHGFVVLSPSADVFYKTTDYYAPQAECGIAWDDPDLAITWPQPTEGAWLLSEKDQRQPRLRDAVLFP